MDRKNFVSKVASLVNLPERLFEKAIEAALSWAYSEFSLVWDVEAETEKLKRTRKRIHALLNDAEERRFIEDDTVKLWLRDLKDVAFDSEDLLDEVETQLNISKLQKQNEAETSRKRKRPWYYFSFPSSISSDPILFQRRRIATAIVEIKERLDEIAEGRKDLRMKRGDAVRRVPIREDPPSLLQAGALQDESRVRGRVREREEIVRVLVSDGRNDVPVIPIFGMGGIGKTTLARLVFKDTEVDHYFNLRIWVGLSKGFDVRRTTKEIIEAVTGGQCDVLSLDLLQHRLRTLLSGKKFLLVLDNVWNEDPYFWETLRVPLIAGAEGSKVLITTRSNSRNMSTTPPISIEGLQDDDCWVLFRDQAFEQGRWDEHQNLVRIGMEIIKRCQGSPLAAKSLGGLLYSVTDEGEWNNVLSEMWELEANENNILPTLKVSYDHLPLHLKHCFAYCSIFPNGYEFDKDELVKLWIAENFIQRRGRRRLETIGGKYFDDLMWRSFFQTSDNYQKLKPKYKMPSLIHDLAQSVSNYECLRLEQHVPCGETKRARYASLFHHNTGPVAFEMLYEYESLRTFKLCGEYVARVKQVPHELLLKLRCLRVLDLSSSEVVELPDSVGDLKHLRYLGLYNTQIEKLPESVSGLYNLQTLELGECYKLLELPKGMSNLVNLRHLGLHLDWERGTDLISMPPGIGRLTSLQTLSIFTVGSESECGIAELKNLNLRGELCILKLENVVNVKDAEEANLKDKQYIDAMMLRWSNNTHSNAQYGGEEEVIKNLCPHTNLKYLWIENYNGTKFPDWLEDPSFTNLEKLKFSNCKRCELLPLLGQLPRLKDLHLEGMHGVKSFGNVVGFPSLEMLTLKDMPDLERWFEVEGGEIPHLREIFVSNCPKLSELSHLPCTLAKLELRNCRGLNTLPLLPSIRDLVVEEGNEMAFRWICGLSSLSSLNISKFSRLKTVPKSSLQHLTSLKDLKIGGCDKLVSLAKNESLQDLTSLECLEISSCPKLTSFCDGGLPSTLRDLRIRHCCNIRSLPQGLQTVASLQHMEIRDIPLLMSLPVEGVPAGLQYLAISGCSVLGTRCQKDRGDDWPKIRHVSYIEIDSIQISLG